MFKQNLEGRYAHIHSEDGSSEVTHEGEVYPRAALRVEGGGYFGKGVRVGNQETLCNGLIFYDSENFFGVSEKFGTTLLSRHTMASELVLPITLFDRAPAVEAKKHIISAVQSNLSRTSTQREEVVAGAGAGRKNAHVDITMKDIQTFYIKIPQNYQYCQFTLGLVLSFHFDGVSEESDSINYSYINDATVYVINETGREVSVSCGNDSRFVYYAEGFQEIAGPRSITGYSIQRLTDEFLLMRSSLFAKKV
jgi:hypothetical protein